MLKNDPLANVLYIDLAAKKSWVEDRADLFNRWLGGAGVGIQLLNEECPPGTDPLSPGNPIIFAVGPLNGLFPVVSKTVAFFKSPLTGNLGESHAGGRSSLAIRYAGYGAIVIRGASAEPVYLAIHGNRVEFKDASVIWGMWSTFTVGRIIRENEPEAGFRTIMRIGRGGEKLVRYASVNLETYRHFGRLGLGAVFGSKRLKAVLVSGKSSISVPNRKAYFELYDKIYKEAVESPVMKKYHDLGTPENIAPINALGAMPVRNLQAARLDDASRISGESFAANYLGRRLACSHCPVACIHIAALREPYVDEAYFFKTTMIGYDYEPMYANGPMLGIAEPESILKLLDKIEIYGIDAMSAGVVLSWATEAMEKGLIGEKETQGLKLAWGDVKTYMDAVKLIVEQPNEFYKALARGVEHAASAYGGKDFALTYGGNEMPGYHTGPAAHIGYLAGARHSHLDNAGYSIDQKMLGKGPLTPEKMAGMILAEERWRQILSSLVACYFARGIYTEDMVLRTLKVAGIDLTAQELNKLGEDIHREKYRFKIREGFKLEEAPLPHRIFETAAPGGLINEDYARQVIQLISRSIAVGNVP